MTLQSHPDTTQDVAPNSPSTSSGSSSGSSGASTSSTEIYPLPFPIDQKEIVLNDSGKKLVNVGGDDNFLTPGSNVYVEGSKYVDIGNRTHIHGDVTVYQSIQGASLQELQNGAAAPHAVEYKKNGQVVNSENKPPSTQASPPKDLKSFLKHRPTQLWLMAILLGNITIASLVLYFSLDVNLTPPPNPVPPPLGHTDDLGDGIQVIQRSEWLARPPINVTKIAYPLKIVRVLHTGGSNCKDYQSCANKVLAMQGWQVGTQGMPDLAYNYMIGGDGNVYVGRGGGVQNEWMHDAIDIGYIGNFLGPYDQMTEKMEEAGKRLISALRTDEYITPDYIVVAQNQTYNTQSPGENIFKKIVKWPHYDNGLYFD